MTGIADTTDRARGRNDGGGLSPSPDASPLGSEYILGVGVGYIRNPGVEPGSSTPETTLDFNVCPGRRLRPISTQSRWIGIRLR
jgi:hypothetical protein